MKIIGLYGPQGAGKSTIANVLAAEYGWQKLSFASTIRECVKAVWPKHVEDKRKNEEFVYGHSYREILQKFGAFARNEIDDSIWVDACLNRANAPFVVIDDLRYGNEREEILNMGGMIVRIDPDVRTEQFNDHESEQDWPKWEPDLQFENSFRNSHCPAAIAESITQILK